MILLLVLFVIGVVSASILVIKESINDNIIYALTNDFYVYKNLTTDLKDTGDYFIVSYYSLTEDEKEFLKSQYLSYDYVLVKEGLYDIRNKILCEDDKVYSDRWDCSGVKKLKDDLYRVLLFKISTQTSTPSPYKSTFCEKRCYDARADVNEINWDSNQGVKTYTLKMKKGFYLNILFRPYGDGCFITSDKLKVCISAGNLKFEFVHSDGTRYTLTSPVLMKYWNTATLGVSPNMITMFVRQHGSDKVDFKYIDLDYKPLDEDDPSKIYSFTINLTPLNNDSYEFFKLSFKKGQTKLPFCGEEIASCSYDYGAFHVWEENGTYMFGGTISSSIDVDPDSLAYYYRNGSYEIKNNTGDMFLNGEGAKRQWEDNVTNEWGFTQQNTKNGITEEYGFSIDTTTLSPYKIGFFREKKDMLLFFYGFESDRKKDFIDYPVPYPVFYSDTAVKVPDIKACPSGSTKIGDFCYYPPKATNCPAGYTFNFSKNRCEKYLTCPEGGTLIGGRCEKSPSYNCPTGFSLDTSSLMCYKPVNCPAGFTYNSSTDRCEKPVVCPSGFVKSSDGRCVKSPDCPTGFTYNSSTGKCEKPANITYTCPSGTTYNSSTGKCETSASKSSKITEFIDCSSNGFAYVECSPSSIANIVSVGLYSQYSRTTCRTLADLSTGACGTSSLEAISPPLKCDGNKRDVRFGIALDRAKIWVDDGCRGRFTIWGCKSGEEYDPSSGLCVTCPSGTTYNSSTGKCETSASKTYSCSTGTLSGTVCQVEPTCPTNSYLSGGECEYDMSYYCSPGSFLSSSFICSAPLTCPTGTTYNSSTDRCEVSATVDCGVYNYSSTLRKCILNIATYCPSTDSFDYPNICYNYNYSIDCLVPGAVYDSSSGKCKLKAGSDKRITDDGIFEAKYDLCPKGQVELFEGIGKDYEGKCFSYLYDAYCVDETVAGKDQDQFGKYCYLQESVTPSVCPSDSRTYTLETPPTASNYICKTTKSPYCSTGERLGGNCYDTVEPQCPFDSYAYSVYRTGDTCNYQANLQCDPGCSLLGNQCICGSFSIKPATCPPGYTNAGFYCVKTDSITCPTGYSYISSLDACGSVIGSACNNDSYMDWSYDSSSDLCIHKELASCPSPYYTFTDPDTGYTACYTKNNYTPSKPEGSSKEKGRVYCKAGDYYWKDRCYKLEGTACGGKYDYTHKNMIVLGQGNSLGEWTGVCWEKTGNGCSSGTYPGRGEYTTENHCLKPEKTFSRIFKGTKTDFALNLCESITTRKFSASGSCTIETNYKSVDSFYKDPTPSICPLSSGGVCLPVAGELSVCGKSKSCAACTESNPPKITTNGTYASIKSVKEKSGKAYGLAWSEYDKLGVENILNNISSSRLPKSSEISDINSLFPEVSGNFWIDTELAGDYFDYSSITISSKSNISLSEPIESILRIKDVSGSFSACSNPDCKISGPDLIKSFLALKDDNGNWYWLGNPDKISIPFDTSSLKEIKFSYDSSTNIYDISVPSGVKIVEISDIAYATGNLSVSDYSGSATFSLGTLKTKPLVLVFDNPADAGFIAECVYTDDYNMLCTADMVECVSGKCPYGDSYQCFPYKGKEYCSKYSDKCLSMADPSNERLNLDTEEGLNDKKADGKFDSTGKCLGTVYIFNGYDRRCRPPGSQTLGNNCCEDDSIDLTGEIELSKCNDSERYLVQALKPEEGTNGKCHYVGEYCAEKWLGVCVQRKKTYCCFGSVMARIVHEQGRPQLGDAFGPDCKTDPEKCWGEPDSPICRGFTPEEFQNLDFSKIDFSEFETALSDKVSSVDTSNIENKFSDFVSDKIAVPDIKVSGSTLKITSLGPTLDFGTVKVGSESSVQSFKVENVGTDTLVFNKISFIGGGTSDYMIILDTCSSTSSLSPGSSCQIQIKFKPVATGRRGAYFRFETNDPDEPRFDVHLVGFGN